MHKNAFRTLGPGRAYIPQRELSSVFLQASSTGVCTVGRQKAFIPKRVYIPLSFSQQKIFTDGSKFNEGVGSAFCSYHNDTLIKDWQSCLSPENSVYQADLFAITNAFNWALSTDFKTALIKTDSLFSLEALQETRSSNRQV